MKTSTFSLTVLFLFAVVSAFACCSTTYDRLNIGPGVNTLCPGTLTDAALGCGLGPNPVPANHLDIYNTSTTTTVDVTRLIIGIPLAAGVSAPLASTLPHITAVGIYNPYSGGLDSLPTPDLAANGCGLLTSASTGPYRSACIGQPVNVGGSENWGNWAPAAGNPASFALYYYNLQGLTNLGGLGLYDIFLGSALPMGTIEIAFGIKPGDDTPCYLTGWNQAGQVVVPEPASWLLVAGAGLALLGGRRLKKSRS